MGNLVSTIEGLYTTIMLRPYTPWRYGRFSPIAVASSKYMEIPLDKDQFEIPAFAFKAFLQTIEKGADSIIAWIYNSNFTSVYKSTEAIFRELLSIGYSEGRLMEVRLKAGEPKYYICYGGVFDEDFTPIAMCSWVIDKIHYPDSDAVKYKLVRPILRIDPKCFILKNDSIQRFLAGKFMSTTLGVRILAPSPYQYNREGLYSRYIDTSGPSRWKVKAEIDSCPFVIKQGINPSISTSNNDLIQLALDYIDDIVP